MSLARVPVAGVLTIAALLAAVSGSPPPPQSNASGFAEQRRAWLRGVVNSSLPHAAWLARKVYNTSGSGVQRMRPAAQKGARVCFDSAAGAAAVVGSAASRAAAKACCLAAAHSVKRGEAAGGGLAAKVGRKRGASEQLQLMWAQGGVRMRPDG